MAAGATFGLTVQVEDSQGDAISGSTVTVAIGQNPYDSTLGGTLTEPVVNGFATFSNLTLSQPGSGYTLTVSDSAIAAALTTSQITVTAGNNNVAATQIAVQAFPSAPVFGESLKLDATVSEVAPGTGVPGGTVTFKEGSTTLGTATLSDGLAVLPLTPAAAGTLSITVYYNGDANDQPSSVSFPLAVGQAQATLGLENLSVTYDGSPQYAVGTTSPAGLSGSVSIAYSQNGVAVANPTQAGEYTVKATLANSNYTAQGVTGTLVIGQATPSINWAGPANITVGTGLGSSQLDATAWFQGTAVPGVFDD